MFLMIVLIIFEYLNATEYIDSQEENPSFKTLLPNKTKNNIDLRINYYQNNLTFQFDSYSVLQYNRTSLPIRKLSFKYSNKTKRKETNRSWTIFNFQSNDDFTSYLLYSIPNSSLSSTSFIEKATSFVSILDSFKIPGKISTIK